MAYSYGPVTDNSSRGFYGDGSDGTVTFDGTTTILGIVPVSSGGRYSYTLVRDIKPENMTVNSTVDILSSGYRIHVRNKLTLQSNSTINMNGGNASGITAGTGYTNQGSLNVTSIAGGAGKNQNGAAQAGNPAGSGPTNTLIAISGGNGGAVSGGATGAGGTSILMNIPSMGGSDYTYLFKNVIFAITGKVLNGTASNIEGYKPINGGPGGGGGAIAGSTGASGAGGGGGGGVLVYAYELDNSGTISANGGNGSNGTGDPAGGGGGGAGGWVSVIVRYMTKQGTITANGGSAGGSVNPTVGATNGAAGYVNVVRM